MFLSLLLFVFFLRMFIFNDSMFVFDDSMFIFDDSMFIGSERCLMDPRGAWPALHLATSLECVGADRNYVKMRGRGILAFS